MLITTDEKIRASVEKHMAGNLVLNDDETEQSIIEEYFSHDKHYNWIIDEDMNGFLCCTEYDDYVVVNFAWHIGRYATLKKMVRMAKELYKLYTVEGKKPMYYSGKTNLYPNHSITIADNVWEFIS